MATLNLGIVAHVDAGKTSLTERLLHAAGVIDELGSVDEGNTQTDTLALERQRGITIRAAVVSFEMCGVTVNLIDTPGHSDFIAEVERSLAVLDGAVLVISAVEGVQAQTRVLMRVLQRLGIPTLLYVNKIDRMGARYGTLLGDIANRLTPRAVALGTLRHLGTKDAAYVSYEDGDPSFRSRLVEVLSEGDDALLADWLDTPDDVTTDTLRRKLAEQTARAQVCPVVFGSALTGAGLEDVARAITTFLPTMEPDRDAPVAARVFAIERGRSGEKLVVTQVTAGTIRVRDKVRLRDVEERLTAIRLFAAGGLIRSTSVSAGHIAQLVGLNSARVGDVIGAGAERDERLFSPPTLETVVEPVHPEQRGALHTALTQLAEQDPLINLRHDDLRGETHVSLFGEVQKEVIEATLEADFGVRVRFRETTPICIERVVGNGAAFELITDDTNPFLATVGLRIAPASPGSGIAFELDVELGSMPIAFFRAVEETVHVTLQQGLSGWQVPDCLVTMTHSGYFPRQSRMHGTFDKSMSSTAGDFRHLTPLVLMDALRQAGTVVEEPVHRFDFDLPTEVLGPAMTLLGQMRAVPRETIVAGPVTHLSGDVPAARVNDLQQRVPALTGGEGDLLCAFEGYRPATGIPPARGRTDFDPLHRREYLRRVAGRS